MKYKLAPWIPIVVLTAIGSVETAVAQVWSVEHQHDVHCVSFSPDGKLLATASWDKSTKLWSLAEILKP
jgi:WD40 repeat protein